MHGLDYTTPVIPPTVPDDIELHFFNPLTCYLLDALSKGQSMGKLAVDPTKGTTIKSLMSARFPGIQATNPQHLQTVLGPQLLPLRHRQRHHRLGAEAAAGARPGSPARWRTRMKHW